MDTFRQLTRKGINNRTARRTLRAEVRDLFRADHLIEETDMTATTMNLFVYGTLKTGGHFWASTLAPMQGVPDKIKGFDLFDLGSFPAIHVAADPERVVIGETFLGVDVNLLPRLDRIEGVPHLYSRDLVTTLAGHECWVYHMVKEPTAAKRLTGGVWIPGKRGWK